MLAYDDPQQSPSASVMDQSHRESCAAAINAAVLQHQGREASSAVESLWQQLTAVQQELKEVGVSVAQLVPLQDVLNHGLSQSGEAATRAGGTGGGGQ